MASKITITDTKNRVTIIPSISNKVETSITNTPVTVTQGTTSVVTVNTLGPQGPQGNPGESPGFDDDIQVRHITASGNISASGRIDGERIGSFRDTTTFGRTHFELYRPFGSTPEMGRVGTLGTGVNSTYNEDKGYRLYLTNMAGGAAANKQHLAIMQNGDVEIDFKSAEQSMNLSGSAKLFVGGNIFTNSNITASGDISASNDIHAQNFILSTNSFTPGKLAGSENSANKYFQLEDGGGHAKLGVFRGFKVVTNEGGASQKAFFGLNEIRITNANLNVNSHITASGNITSSGTITADNNIGTYSNFILLNEFGSVLNGLSLPNYNTVRVGGFNNSRVQIARHTGDGAGGVLATFNSDYSLDVSSSISAGNHITASGNISASGDIIASGDINASQMLLERSGSVILTLNSTQNGQGTRINLREDGNQFGAYMLYDSSDFHIGSIDGGADTDSIIIAREGDITFRHNVEIGNQKTLTVLLDNDRTTPSFTVQDENTSNSVFSISGNGSGNSIANLVLTGSVNIVPSASVGSNITASGNISASGDITAANFISDTTLNQANFGGAFIKSANTPAQLHLGQGNSTTAVISTQRHQLDLGVSTGADGSGGTRAFKISGSVMGGGAFITGKSSFMGTKALVMFSDNTDPSNTYLGVKRPQQSLYLATNTHKLIGPSNRDLEDANNLILGTTLYFTSGAASHKGLLLSGSGDVHILSGSVVLDEGITGTTKIKGDVSIGPQGDAGLVAKDDSGNNFTLSLRDTTPSMVFNDQTGTVGRGEIEFVGQAATSESNFVFNATSGSHGEPATYQFQLQGEEVVRFTTSSVVLDYDNMPTSDPGVKGTIYRSSSAGISNLLFISPGS